MKQKLFTLLTLLLTVCSGAWATDVTIAPMFQTSATIDAGVFTITGSGENLSFASKTFQITKNNTGTITITSTKANCYIKSVTFTDSNSKTGTVTPDENSELTSSSSTGATITAKSGKQLTSMSFTVAASGGTAKIATASVVIDNQSTDEIEAMYAFTGKSDGVITCTHSPTTNVTLGGDASNSSNRINWGNNKTLSISSASKYLKTIYYQADGALSTAKVAANNGTYVGTDATYSGCWTASTNTQSVVLTQTSGSTRYLMHVIAILKSISTQSLSGVKVGSTTLTENAGTAGYTVSSTTITLTADQAVTAAPDNIKLLRHIVFSDSSEGDDEISVSFDETPSAGYYTGTATIGETTYTVKVPVELSDPSFSLSETSITTLSTSQIKVGSNAGLDGVTLKNITYGTPGIVTVNASTGVVTPVAVGTTTITFDTDETTKYNASTDNELTITVTNPKCAKPTVTISDFNFENKKYVVSVTNNEASSTLKVSTDGGSSWSDAAAPYDVTSTATYQFKSVKDSYDDSDVATASITHDSSKKNVAWVHGTDGNYSGYNAATDPMVIALKTVYNVIPVGSDKDTAPKADLSNADLIVCTEAMTGNTTFSNGMDDLLDGTTPMIGLKFYNYSTGRWAWGTPSNPTSTTLGFTTKNANYKVLDGVTFESDGTIKLATAKGTSNNVIQTVNFDGASTPADNVIMGTLGSDDTKSVMHYSATKKYFGLGLSVDCRANYTDNATTIVKNAAAMLIAGDDLTGTNAVTQATGTISASGWTTFSSSEKLDLSTISGGTAYYASGVNGANAVLTPTGDVVVAAGTGLMIKGTANDAFTIDVTDASVTFSEENLLVGLPTGGTVAVAGSGYNYVFGWSDPADPGFYKVNATSAVLGSGKAYLHTTAELADPGAKLGLVFDGETTGIESAGKPQTTTNREVYNLAGQRVAQPTKGLYIVNGRKVVIK